MKVKDLIAALQILDQEALVVLSSDAEGNSYSSASYIAECFYDEENSDILTEQDCLEFGGTDRYEKCVTIWP